MAAILVSFGFTFLIDRMTEVLTPDIYIELTGLLLLVISVKMAPYWGKGGIL